MSASRSILERVDQNAATTREVTEALREHSQVQVLDEGVSNLLVEGAPEEVKKVVAGLPGWQIVPLTSIPVPDAHPRVLRRPGG